VGNRNQYSSLCTQLASQGYVVLCVEHADGSACAARLAVHPRNAADLPITTKGWRFYGGWGGEKVVRSTTVALQPTHQPLPTTCL
jgi:capsule polysaccharide export protein KpsC/LpsZ